jgi:predicted P-loop ATPase
LDFSKIGSREAIEALQGRLIVELQEMTGLSKRDRNSVKQWITLTHDEAQRKYQNQISVFPRKFVVAGSTNETQWLTDPTGNRRFWPVKVSNVNVDAVVRDKDQLWAEAYTYIRDGKNYWVDVNDPVHKLFEIEQRARYNGDPWESLVANYAMRTTIVSVEGVFRDALQLERARWSIQDKRRVVDILRSLGFEIERKGGKEVWTKAKDGL